MKYALISDIHGNIIALKRALELIEEEHVEKIFCLGDIVGIGTRSDDCVKMIMSLKDKVVCVRGNHEDRCLFGVPEYIHDGLHKMSEEDIAQEHWISDHVSEESKEFLRSLPPERIIDLEGFRTVITHYPLKDDGTYNKFYYFPIKVELAELFDKYNATINIYGHTHIARVKTDGNKIYINTGTLGTTDFRDYGTYGILTIENGKYSYVQKSFTYDLKAALHDFDVVNSPKKDHMRDKFFGYKR